VFGCCQSWALSSGVHKNDARHDKDMDRYASLFRQCPKDSALRGQVVVTNRYLDLSLCRNRIQEYGPWRSCSILWIYLTIDPFILPRPHLSDKSRLIKHDAGAASASHP